MKDKGLLLEGGGMRGIYTTGVLDFFLDKQLDFEYIIGVSAGACHSASFVSKQRGRAYKTNTDYLNDHRYLSLRNWIFKGSIFDMNFLFNTIPNELYPIDTETFNKSKTKLEMVCTNIETGKAEYALFKDVVKDIPYLQASSSLPILAKIVNHKGKKLLDGGVSDSIPYKRLLEQKLNKNILILTRDKDYRKSDTKANILISIIYRKYPKLVKLCKNRHIDYNESLDNIKQLEKEGKLFVIYPTKQLKVSKLEKDKKVLKALYDQGYSDGQYYYDELLEYLNS